MEQKLSFSLAAIGKAGDFVVEVLSRPDGGWSLSIETPAWCFGFALSSPSMVGELATFFRSHAGREEFAELVVGSFGDATVRVLKDDESLDRFFFRAAGGGSMIELTFVSKAVPEFAAAIAEAAAEFRVICAEE